MCGCHGYVLLLMVWAVLGIRFQGSMRINPDPEKGANLVHSPQV